MKLFFINPSEIKHFSISESDAQLIIQQLVKARKAWAQNIVGFFINQTPEMTYVAVNVKGENNEIESVEYIDLETNQPEFSISQDVIDYLSSKEINSTIAFDKLEDIFAAILSAPLKQRNWQVYEQFNRVYQ